MALKLLAEIPEMARRRQEFKPAIRIHPYWRHLIIYLAEDDFIDVVRIVHAQANWSVLFSD
ncbi:type II toxin-antitoxin system RelE/ParE family toxin [Ruegeria sp. SCP11]|uniref:type II toxin-antitoxin system RelE/ParE family toxin n=1 Tax=Ruegeria sp. SCP11 TaxID=3141378 RepID=UPI003339944F